MVDNKIKDKEDKLEKLFKFIGYKIRSDYAEIAITCSAYANENELISQDSLAVVGDHIIKLILTSKAYKNNPHISKMDITNEFQKIETNKHLEMIGARFEIKDFLFSKNTDLDGTKKLATSIEAIIGAIYLSEGIDKATLFAERINLVDKTEILLTDN
ncbi:MAG: hypothetical protein K8Q99_06890 [Acholeplasmataceae bacterium]|nr:hypothetical protein [Acholeplasmataceae bacterium]